MSSNSKVVIIGSGASGIAAATKLVDSGFTNVLVLDAEERIGGRIHTIPFGENIIDLGAQWVHGEKDNIVYDLVHSYDLLESTGDVYDEYMCIRSNRDVVPDSVSQRLKAIVNFSLHARQEDLINYEGSLGKYLSDHFYTALERPENADIEFTIAKEFFENYKKFENSVEASDTLFEVSGKGYVEYWECEGDILLNWKDKGYIALLNLLMKSNGNDYGILNKRILLNKCVTGINWDPNGLKRTQINCSDGSQIEADHVICTMSLGVLKEKHLDIFQPNLPEQKIRAIKGLAFGTVNKIFIEFPSKFWPEDFTGFTMLWRDEDLSEIQNTERAWLEDVFGFYRVSYQPNILSGWIIGPNGRHMETLPEHEVLDGCMYLFRKFLPWSIPQQPINFKTSTWYINPNFRGSYSFRSMQTEDFNTSAKDLSIPINKLNSERPILQFAGEASSQHYYSTVHGAVEAGWREAKRLIDLYHSSKKSQL